MSFIELPEFDIENIILFTYTNEIRKTILSNLMNFTKLKGFDCNSCDLTELPEYLPISLTNLNVSFNNISFLPNLKHLTSLVELECCNNTLTKISELPDTLKILSCHQNNLTELPYLPDLLTHLDCENNKLIELPYLPHTLIELNCSTNFLTKLPDLSKLSLIELDCVDNYLTEIPNLPNSLIYLYCDNNKLIKLPTLPNSLLELYCSDNNLSINGIPELPCNLEHFNCENNKLTELPDLPSSLTMVHSISGNLLHQTYYCCQPDTTIKSNEMFLININQTNAKNKGIKRMKLLDRTLLLEQSAKITMNPKRIERLLDNLEIDFFDGSFDTLTS